MNLLNRQNKQQATDLTEKKNLPRKSGKVEKPQECPTFDFREACLHSLQHYLIP